MFCASIAVALMLGSALVYNLWWGRPTSFNLFVERVLVKKALSDPELLSYLGIVDNTPLDFFSGNLSDMSHQHNIQELKEVQDSLAMLRGYDRAKLTEQEQLTYDILEQFLLGVLDGASFGYGTYLNSAGPYPVNQLFGVQNSLPDFMANIHRVTNKKSAERYIKRLSQWEKKFQDLIAELKLREEHGVIPPRFVIEQVLEESKKFISVVPAENMLFTTFSAKLQKIEIDRDLLEKMVLGEIETRVYPAYIQLIAFLEGQRTRATHDDGVWKFPAGDRYYASMLKYHTTTNEPPAKVHELGISEIARIEKEMRSILDRLGHQDLSVGEAMRSLGKDPKFLYPDTDQGRTEILADFHAIFDRIQTKLPELFLHLPKGKLKIEAIPDFKAKTAPMAYYEPGDLKGTRPGVFFVNTHDVKSQTKLTMPSLAYHEGVPGHHLQISIALEIPKLPAFRKVVPFTAYQEGWALYCEQLAKEYGFITDPYHDLGRLQMEMIRAVRLVVDTGIHYKRWTREGALQYMIDKTGKNEWEVGSEIDRYIVLPGQACSYKIGMIKLLELREKMKNQKGAAFDIKEFHDIVLRNGAMPLTLLEKTLDRVLDGR